MQPVYAFTPSHNMFILAFISLLFTLVQLGHSHSLTYIIAYHSIIINNRISNLRLNTVFWLNYI